MSTLPKYTMVKKMIKNLITMMFYLLEDNELLSEVNDFMIVKKKLMVVAINLLVCYISRNYF